MEISIRQYLSGLPKEELLFIPNPGNGGDALIAYATVALFKELGLNYKICTPDINASGRVVLYGGGGMFVERYNFAAQTLRAIHKDAKKVVILPHTISGHEDTLRLFGSNIEIICREPQSVSHVTSTGTGAQVFLCHDLAFTLSMPDLLAKQHLCDRNLQRELDLRMGRKWYYRNMVASFIHRRRDKTLYCFRTDSEQTNVDRPVDNLDLTDRINYDRTQRDERLVEKTAFNIAYHLQRYGVIHTNRMHVAIASMLLGKTVNLYPNDYRKIENVYAYSIKDHYPNVRWVTS